MDEILKLDHIYQFNDFAKKETFHPLVSVIDFSTVAIETKPMRISLGVYAIFFKDVKCGNIRYGRDYYDYQKGTLVFMAPGQIAGFEEEEANDEEEEESQLQGWALLFHPDLIRGTSLGNNIKDYTFFSYEVHEALHLSEGEQQIVIDCLHKIDYELRHAIDKHSRTLIVSNIELLLNYCVRFYDRQFITRGNVNKDIIVRFERLLNTYFQSGKPQTDGLPSVKFCATQLHLSPNYLGDLIKKETGKTAQEHIQLLLMNMAKEKVFDASKTVSEIAYELGFKHPQHFSRMFKKVTGYSPQEYRLQRN
ncbi:MAG TPA: helix-turn-helix domain-containing protein [Bacteroidales bacterium]|nr:helix-turn-helix domain-containing protein [Bacteroidales bacterium]